MNAFSVFGMAATPAWHTSKIKSVYPQANGRVVFTFVDDAPSCPNANSPKYHYLSVGDNGVTQEGLNNMLSVALTAAATGREVAINFDADTNGCQINRLLINFE
ncbi:response regulator receiver protein [bacterium SCSIO 12696]|nr:response regulator receiver protein [bacterium SCSIO 12696]